MRCSPCTILVLVVYLYPISRVRLCAQGRPSPLRPCCTSPLFQVSPISKNFQTLWKIFELLPCPEKFPHFHPPKFLMTFFQSSTTNFEFCPLFCLFQYVSPSLFPCFAKIIISPLL